MHFCRDSAFVGDIDSQQHRKGMTMAAEAKRAPESQAAGSEAEALPIIDLRNFSFDEAGADAIAREMDRVFSEVGFCYIASAGVPQRLIDDIFAASARFH